jgi:hypothetical protein
VGLVERIKTARFESELARITKYYVDWATVNGRHLGELVDHAHASEWHALTSSELAAWGSTCREFKVDRSNFALRSLLMAELATVLGVAPDVFFEGVVEDWMLRSGMATVGMVETIGRLRRIPGASSGLRDVAIGCHLGLKALELRFADIIPAVPDVWASVQLALIGRWIEGVPFPPEVVLQASARLEIDEVRRRWQELTGSTVDQLWAKLADFA